MKMVCEKIFGAIRNSLNQIRDKLRINNKKGFIMIMATVVIPTVMLLLYLMVKNSGRSEQRIAFEQATKNATLDTARKYIQGRTFATQSAYLDRIAAVSFDNAAKNTIGITNNIIPLTITTKGYALNAALWEWYVNDTYSLDGTQPGTYWKHATKRYKFLIDTSASTPFPNTVIDPDADSSDETYPYSDTQLGKGYLLRLTDNGSYNQRKIVAKSSEASENTINVTRIDDDTLQVETNVTINNKNYTTSYKAKAPELNADIVLGIPVNTAASTTDNDPYGTAVWTNSTYKSTPLWQIKDECREFVKKILSYRKCAIGLIPYWGNVTVPKGMAVPAVSHGKYKYSNYAATNPSIPIAESYKFLTPSSGGGLGEPLNTFNPTIGNTIRSDVLQQFMYRSDLEPYLTTYMNDGTTNKDAIEALLYGEVNSETSFMFSGLEMIYAPAANVLAGYSRRHMATYPTPYPMYGLTQDPMVIFRYFSLVSPFADQYKRSSFAYLPIMFGMSMLSNGFQNHLTAAQQASFDTDHSSRKKALVLICNQADLWFPRELTYFGFVNDASYIPMVDGDRLDYEKGVFEDAGDGYFRSKIYRSTDVVYDTGNYNNSTNKPGMFFNEYDEKVAIKCNYPLKDDDDGGEGKMLVYESTSQTTSYVDDVIGSSNFSNGVYTCVVPSSATESSVYFTIGYSKSDTASDVIAKIELKNCEITSIPNTHVGFRTEGNYGYFYEKSAFSEGDRVAFQVHVKFKAGGSSADSPTTGTYSLVLPKPGNTKMVLDTTNVEGELKIGEVSYCTINRVTCTSVAGNSSSGVTSPYTSKITHPDSYYYCKVPAGVDYIEYTVNVSITDRYSMLLFTQISNCEFLCNNDTDNTLISNSNLCFRQSSNAVYVCRVDSFNTTNMTMDITLRIKFISDPSGMKQYQAWDGKMEVYDGSENPYTTATISSITCNTSSTSRYTPKKSGNIWSCPAFANLDYVSFTVNFTKTDTSPVVLKLKLHGCELVTNGADDYTLPDDSNFCARQDEEYVYICRTSGNASSVTLRVAARTMVTGDNKVDYPNINGEMKVYKSIDSNFVSGATLNSVSNYSGGSTPTSSSTDWKCTVPGSATGSSPTQYSIQYTKSGTSPIIAKLDLAQCEIVSLSDSNLVLRQWNNHVYIVEKTLTSSGTTKTFQIWLRSKLTLTHGGDLIQYPYIYGHIRFTAPGDHSSATISKIEGLTNVGWFNNNERRGDVPIDKEYAEYKVTFSKSDTSPVVFRMELLNAELWTNGSDSDYTLLSDSNFRVRQDKNYVYVCRTSGSATNVTIRVKYAFGTNGTTTGATQYPYLSYFHDKLSPASGKSSEVNMTLATELRGDKAYNVSVYPKCKMSTKGLTWERALTNDSPTQSDQKPRYDELCVNYRMDSKTERAVHYVGNDNYTQCYYGGIGIEASLTGYCNDDNSRTNNQQLDGIDRIEATWNGSTNIVPHWPDGKSDTHQVSFGFGTDFVFAPVDGDRATDDDKSAVSNVVQSVKIVEKDGVSANETISRWQTRYVVNLGTTGSSYKVEIKFNSSVVKNPIICDVRYPMGAWVEELGGNQTASNYLRTRSDGSFYYIVPSSNFSGTGYVYVKSRPNNTSTTEGGRWELAYANNHYLGNSTTITDGQFKWYTFASSGHEGPGLKSSYSNYGGGLRCYPYWIYGRAVIIKVISKDDYVYEDTSYSSSYYFIDSDGVVANPEIRARTYNKPWNVSYTDYYSCTYGFSLQTGTDIYEKDKDVMAISGYKIQPYTPTISRAFKVHEAVRSFSWNKDVSRPFVYNYVDRIFSSVSAASISFSGNYTNTYSSLTSGGYNVIYIPRDKFSGTLGTNDSATINFTLNGAKVVYIEWSNHLNGTEGSYFRTDANDLRAKDLRVGTSADGYDVWYEKFTRSKNSSARFYDDPSKDEYGDPTLFTGTETHGWARPTSALGDSYVYVVNNYNNNSSYKRSRQVANLRHQAGYSETYDYPRWHGDLSYILENTCRNSGIYAWSQADSGKHVYEFNYMNCISRYCSLYERFKDYNMLKGTEEMGMALNTSSTATWGVSGNVNWVARLGLAESTVDANRILMAADYQSINSSNYVVYDSTWRMRNTITPKMVEAFNSKFGANGRIYVIHYRYDPAGKNGWLADLGGVYKNYTAADQAELKSTLNVILMDIKQWAGYQDAKIVD